MNRLLSLVLALAAARSLAAADVQIDLPDEFARCVDPEVRVTKLAGGMGFVEGPVWLRAEGGYLVFSDIPGDMLKKWTPASGVVTFRQPSRHANGNTVDATGRLLTCEHSGRRVAVQDRSGGLKTVVDSVDGKKLNSPNDIVVRSDGTLWFTDPEYGLKTDPATRQKVGKEQPGNYVYRHDPRTGVTVAVAKDLENPNGLAFSPDEKRLYVADSGTPQHIKVYDVTRRGVLTGGGVLCAPDKGPPDGLRVDRAGRIWSSAADGVQIFLPDGRRVGKILIPERAANVCFGGADGRTLFVTAQTSLYAVPVRVAGAGF